MEEIRQGKRALESLSAKLAQKELGDLLDGSQVVKDGVRVVAKKLQDISLDTMRTMGDSIKDQAPDTVAVLAAVAGGQNSVAVRVRQAGGRPGRPCRQPDP